MIAYLDCVGGLAGDMLLAALLDAGAPEDELRAIPGRLGLHGVEINAHRVERHGIGALHVDVIGDGHAHGTHGAHEAHEAHGATWTTIRELIETADLDPLVSERSLAVFRRLIDAESRIHGVGPEDVHLHELGSADTLVDVCGAVTLLAALGVERLVCSPLPLGRGTIRIAHGVVPLPAPATVELLRGCPVFGVDFEGELVTPTGAALAATLADGWGPLPALTIEHVGYGAGTRDFAERANLVRVVLGRVAKESQAVEVRLLETNLDDFNPELVPDAVERCYAAGALDVWTAPVLMKKGRHGIVLSALVRPEDERVVAHTILEETSTLGVRVGALRRYELERSTQTVEIDGHPIRVKLGRLDGRLVNVAPEHDDCAAVAQQTGVPVKSVWALALTAAREIQ
ncbi:MAG: nickel pincer cofactor biosynthesis protein LarC [Thermoleophilia bacterium]|nr:nickel pincer cofactor biosynthesis protein LarC [Thermoleophilia bacterium]